LKDYPQVALVRRDRSHGLVSNEHLTSRRCDKTSYDHQSCSLSTPAGSQKGQELAALDFQVEILDRNHGTIVLADPFQSNASAPYILSPLRLAPRQELTFSAATD